MGDTDDLATLSELSENGIMTELQARYSKNIIYTYIGDILIAVNPYTPLSIYETEQCTKYSEVGVRSSLPPHVFAVSDAAYHNMIRNAANQCCVVSGESGAGKTETTKLLIQHIAFLCRDDSNDLHDRIVQVNPLMEAFGNAQTVLNFNSSRFGKYIELMFDGKGHLQGAKISEYLLEKSRVTFQSAGERNFHIFYYFFAGLDETRKKANLLESPEEHRILRPPTGGPVFSSEDEMEHCKAQWNTLMKIMEIVGFSEEDNGHVTIDGILAILAAILHITDVDFVPDLETEGVYIKNDQTLLLASQLLNVSYDRLTEAMISTVSNVGDETVMSLKTEAQANDGRDALAKALYGRLFSWIVYQINEKLGKTKENAEYRTIGILDIYGFENFTNNSFEQLCINITNEQLQCFFNEYIFRWELEEYEREGISGSDITYADNKQLLDFFLEPLKPMGLLALLDDESIVPRGTDLNFLDKLSKGFPNLPEFKRPRGQQLEFVIQHFAGQVTYSVDGFLEKNRDTLSTNVLNCMKASEARLVCELFSSVSDFGRLVISKYGTVMRSQRKSRMFLEIPDLSKVSRSSSSSAMNRLSRMITGNGSLTSPTKGRVNVRSGLPGISETGEGRNTKQKTLGMQFKNSLNVLMNELSKAQPHFIRCIKPNAKKAANNFNSDMVLQQLRYTGVLETVKIRKQGYPTRLHFVDFMQRYRFIHVTSPMNCKPDGQSCQKLLESVGLQNWKIGHSKVFLKYYHVEMLNVKLTEFARSVAVCQKYVRAFIAQRAARRKYEELLRVAKEYEEQMRQLTSTVRNFNQSLVERLQRMRIQDEEIRNSELQAATKKDSPQTSSGRGTITPQQAVKLRTPLNRTSRILQQAIPEEPTCAPDCNCKWKNFQPSLTRFSQDHSQNDSLQTLLSDTLPKMLQVPTYLWAKVYVMERNAIVGKIYVTGRDVVLDNSNTAYLGAVCGLNNGIFQHLPQDQLVQTTLRSVGAGVKLVRREDDSIDIVNLSTIDITVRNAVDGQQALSRELISRKGVIESQTSVKVFDMSEYKRLIAEQLKKWNTCDPNLFNRFSIFSLSLGKHASIDTETPLWIAVVNMAALDLLGKIEALEDIIRTHNIQLSADENTMLKLQNNWKHLSYNRKERSEI